MKTGEKSYKDLFLMKIFLGREADFENPEDIIMRCIKNAYVDMLSAGRFYIKCDMEETCIAVKKIFEEHGYKFSRQMIEKTLLLFGREEIIGKDNKYATRYGLAQKLVNMCFKNFYICSEYIDEKIDFSLCDCPLDSVVLSKLSSNAVWSKLTKEKYKEIQDKINQMLKKVTLDKELEKLGNLAFDFIVW